MKKQLISILGLTAVLSLSAQPVIETFETFSLNPSSFYKDTMSANFQSSQAIFSHQWVGGQYPYWSGGFSYTNIHDSVNGTYTNLYGVIPFKGFNNSDKFVVGQDGGVIRTKNKITAINGFYFTNTTYAYKSMRFGDAFARKFGDTTGTGSGTSIAQGAYPDFLKMLVYGYRNGQKLADSVEIYLADYRAATASEDYIVNNWRYANTSKLGLVDSIEFVMRGSVYNAFGPATPFFFGLDNFETGPANLVGFAEQLSTSVKFFPVPVESQLNIRLEGSFNYQIRNATGLLVYEAQGFDSAEIAMFDYPTGLYILEVRQGAEKHVQKIIKN